MELKTFHRAVLTASRYLDQRDSLSNALGLPDFLVQGVLDDLILWGLLKTEDGKIVYTMKGASSATVLEDTGMSGFWTIEKPKNWFLGRGHFVYLLRLNLSLMLGVTTNLDHL